MHQRVEVYRRADGRFEWRRLHGGEIVSTSGGQGYENLSDCLEMAVELNPNIPVDVVAGTDS